MGFHDPFAVGIVEKACDKTALCDLFDHVVIVGIIGGGGKAFLFTDPGAGGGIGVLGQSFVQPGLYGGVDRFAGFLGVGKINDFHCGGC